MKKRNKAYKKKIVCNPLGIRNNYLSEIPILTAVSTIGTDLFTDQQAYFIESFAYLMGKLSCSREIVDPVLEAIDSILKSFEATGKIEVSEAQIKIVRDNVPLLISHYRSQSNYNVVKASLETLKEINRESNQNISRLAGKTAKLS